ncbi:hypothetical protein L873DRAFT_1827031 [Choiromyces venosus 120613-1]|uniref:SUR7-domain-containing protein n=1 Tax=Choiromyces venosus 120613-1 TaxID=1336337 RepID=A0A3N4K706_9PEZI|nr:hypothetical protein L873DRAFT_1827031 [Choiromyces venosus 120613-1]
MGKAGRFACILTPMLLTLASLACVTIVMIGGTNKNSSVISGLYFLRIDTRFIDTPSHIDLIPGTDWDDQLLKSGFNATASDLGLADYYTSSLWNYCSGKALDGDNWQITDCGKPSVSYAFDPVRILDVEKEGADVNFPDSVKKVSKAVSVASKVMAAMYVLGTFATIITFAVGWFGLLSRWGSCVTTIFADIAFLFLFTASIISTALYVSIREAFNKALKDFSVNAEINKQMFTITWLAVAFSFGACLFWMFSTCCCSGKRSRVMGTDHKGKGKSSSPSGSGAKGGYERIAAPYQGGSGPGMKPMAEVGKKQGAGYEPFRHA